jgi:multiple sugar transport system ATP-binding protein
VAALSISQVRKVYGSNVVLQAVDLEVQSGEFVILVGPSGCGKSTLLNMIAGLDHPTSGRIAIDGRDVTDVLPKDRDIAMVFQTYALYPTMTVARNISFGLEMRGMPEAQRNAAVLKVAKTLQIEALLARKPSQLSGGQRQRVAMGRALAREPKLFLFDEPLSNLDAKLRVEMRAEIKLLHQRSGTTTVYVTHDQVEAMTLGDRIAVMRNGALQQVAPPEEIYGRPANRFVAEFIGSPPMNMIEAQRGGDGGLTAQGVQLQLSPEQRRSLAAGAGPAFTYGVRPEALHLTDASASMLSGRVRLVEPTGPETFAFLDSPVGALMCRASGRLALKIGDAVHLRWAAADVHLFDAASQHRVGDQAQAPI